jgi:hypothetical protein
LDELSKRFSLLILQIKNLILRPPVDKDAAVQGITLTSKIMNYLKKIIKRFSLPLADAVSVSNKVHFKSSNGG